MQENQHGRDIKTTNLILVALFDGISEEIMVVDENGIIQDVNKVFLNECGMRKEDVLGQNCSDIRLLSGNPCDLTSQYCPLERAKETGQRVEITHRHGQKGVEFIELSRIMYPVAAEGTSRLFIEISRDVTEYRNLIRKLQSSEKKFRTILDTATDAIIIGSWFSITQPNRYLDIQGMRSWEKISTCLSPLNMETIPVL